MEANPLYITYQELAVSQAQYAKQFNDRKVMAAEQRLQRQMTAREEEYVATHQECPRPVLEYLGESVLNLNSKVAAELVADDSDDPNVMKSIECITDTMFVTVPHEHTFTPQERMRYHLGQILNQIGKNSVYGIVFAVKYDNTLPMVMKAPRGRRSNDDLLHEMVIGTIMNTLRGEVPNFVYTYGLTKSANPIPLPSLKKEALSFVRNNRTEGSYYKLFIEYINGVSFDDFILNCTGEECRIMLMQIFYALEQAQQQYEFTHHDLHGQNVLITAPHPHRVMTYHRPGGAVRYLTSSHTALILDYGMSHARYQGVDYGNYLGVFSNTNNYHPLADAFRLVGYLAYVAEKSSVNPEVRAVLREAWLELDHTDPYPEILTAMINLNFVYYTQVIQSREVFSAYLDRLEAKWPSLLTVPPSPPPVIRLSLSTVLQKENLSTIRIPDHLMGCYYLMEYLIDHNRREDAHNLYDYYISQPGYSAQLAELGTTIDNELTSIREAIAAMGGNRNLADPREVQSFLLEYLRGLSMINEAVTHIKVMLTFDPANSEVGPAIENLSQQLKTTAWGKLTTIDHNYLSGQYSVVSPSQQWLKDNYPAIRDIIFT